jgi:hypothetical protein
MNRYRMPHRVALVIFALALALAASGAALGQGGPAKPYFTNVTSEVGLDGAPAFRIAVGDLNGDGYPDVFVHLEPTHGSGDVLDKQVLYLNEEGSTPGTRTFVDRTAGSGIRDNRDGTADGRHSDAAIFADVDNDGDLDVFTNVYLHRSYDLAEGTNDLLLNNGDATFTLSPASTFHTEENYNTPAAVFLDYDNDSQIDLFIGTWYKPDSTLNVDHLYQGDGAGGFANVSASAGIHSITTCVYAVGAFDYDDDGDMDLVAPPYSRTVFDSYPRHWRNNGDGTFTEVAEITKYNEDRGFPLLPVSFGTMPRDFDNDGDVDFLEIMTHGVGDGAGDIHTTAVTNDGGVFSWDYFRVYDRGLEDDDMGHHGDHFASWTDFDGDGLVDFVLTESGYDNPGLYLFKQAADHTFAPDTVGSGLDEINDNGLSPGYATPLDYDLDGDEDLLIIASGTLHLYRNDVGNQSSWLAVRLEGIGAPGYSNRSAIGAKVEVTANGTTHSQTVYAGNGHEGPMRPLTLYFGLGDATVVDSVRIRWPNETNTVQELTSVGVDQFLDVREPCELPPDASQLRLERSGGNDILMSWDDPSVAGVSWNVYRELTADPSGWTDPHESGVGDEDASTPGIQHLDEDGAVGTSPYFYLVTSVNVCGETPLR